MKHKCPVCGYNELPYPPENYAICPCCLTEFGDNDEQWGIDLLREDWIAAGAKWESESIPQPMNYNPIVQLLNIPYEVTEEDRAAVTAARTIKQAG